MCEDGHEADEPIGDRHHNDAVDGEERNEREDACEIVAGECIHVVVILANEQRKFAWQKG